MKLHSYTFIFFSLDMRMPYNDQVGPSGGGKSTMTKLFLRFYDVTSGCIRLDGTDIRELNVNWYRQQIGYVGQEPVLFYGTIRDNIANGKPGATEEEIINAAKVNDSREAVCLLHVPPRRPHCNHHRATALCVIRYASSYYLVLCVHSHVSKHFLICLYTHAAASSIFIASLTCANHASML